MSTRRSYRSVARDASAIRTRRRIIDAAEQQLLEGGYHSMTVASLAAAAAVSPQTIYNSVGGKAAVIKALYDVRLAGDDEPVPIGERPSMRAIQELPDAGSMLRAYIELGGQMYTRVGAVLGALIVDGPGTDADLRRFVETIEGERRSGNTAFVGVLERRFGLPPGVSTRRAVDMLWALTSFELADRLVRRCGWTVEQYQEWIADIAVERLSPATTRTRRADRGSSATARATGPVVGS